MAIVELGLFLFLFFFLIYKLFESLEIINTINMSNQKSESSTSTPQDGKKSKTKLYYKKNLKIHKNPGVKDSALGMANITHKKTTGSDNWRKFLELGQFVQTDNQNIKPKSMHTPSQKSTRWTSFEIDTIDVDKVICDPESNDERSEAAKREFKKNPLKIRHEPSDSCSVNGKSHPINKLNDGTVDLNEISSKEKDSYVCFKKPVSVRPKLLSDQPKLTKQIAIDCEMVGVEVGVKNDMLARVSLVNYEGECVYDKFVKPTEHVLDYRTRVSGVRPKDLENATNFETVQREVSDIIKGRVLVGHALKNDLKVLFLTHPKYLIRDTSRFRKFREGKTPALKNLAKKYLGVEIQDGEHSSIQDAHAAMQLYRMFRKEWEQSIKTRKPYSGHRSNVNQAATIDT